MIPGLGSRQTELIGHTRAQIRPSVPSALIPEDRVDLSSLAGRMSLKQQEAFQRALQALPEVVLDAVERPGGDVMTVLDAALNLGGNRSLLAELDHLSGEQAEAALQALARLIQRGVVGYEYREINGEPQKVFIDVAIGSDLHRAPLVRGGRYDNTI